MVSLREAITMKTFATASLVAGCMFALAATAWAAEPTQADFDACNRVAAQGVGSSPSASPSAGGATGPSITTPSGTPDTTAGVQPGGAAGKTGPMITGSGRTSDSAGGVREGTGAVTKDSTGGTASAGADARLRGMSDKGTSDQAYKTAYQDCMKQRGF
jgi:hypothetical protein